MMNTIRNLFFLVVVAGCMSTVTSVPRENGWYHLKYGGADSLSSIPIVTVSDFEVLRLNADCRGNLLLIGQICKSKCCRWADETEKAIGHRIAFVYNDTIVAAPVVNARIESGAFMISSENQDFIRRIYKELSRGK